MAKKTTKKELLEMLDETENFYQKIIDCLLIPEGDLIYRNMVLGMLKRQSKDAMVISIWKYLNSDQSVKLREYINQMSTLASWMNEEDIVIEFAMLYPEIRDQVFADLAKFFEDFITKFNEILRA